jgi:hypothetical protein
MDCFFKVTEHSFPAKLCDFLNHTSVLYDSYEIYSTKCGKEKPRMIESKE